MFSNEHYGEYPNGTYRVNSKTPPSGTNRVNCSVAGFRGKQRKSLIFAASLPVPNLETGDKANLSWLIPKGGRVRRHLKKRFAYLGKQMTF